MVILFSIIGALINAASLLQYIYYLISKKIILNKSTWIIMAFIMLLQAGTYFEIVRKGNPWIATTNIVVATGFLFIAGYSFIAGRFAKLTKFDILSLFTGLVIIAIWKTTGDVVAAHLILQIAILISYVPTIMGILHGRLREKPIPWLIGAISYFFVIASVLLESGFSNLAALVYPVIIGLGINGLVALLAFKQEKGYIKSPSELDNQTALI